MSSPDHLLTTCAVLESVIAPSHGLLPMEKTRVESLLGPRSSTQATTFEARNGISSPSWVMSLRCISSSSEKLPGKEPHLGPVQRAEIKSHHFGPGAGPALTDAGTRFEVRLTPLIAAATAR
jgi:hypothetical protein